MRMVHEKRSRGLLWLRLWKEIKASQPVFVSSCDAQRAKGVVDTRHSLAAHLAIQTHSILTHPFIFFFLYHAAHILEIRHARHAHTIRMHLPSED